VRYPLRDTLELDLVPHCALIALRSPVTLRRWYSNERTTSSLYYSGDTGTNRGTSLRRPFDVRHRAQIRSDVLCQAAEDLAAEEQAQVEQRDPLSRDISSHRLYNAKNDFTGPQTAMKVQMWMRKMQTRPS
jgi:hypothetical protein